MSQTVESRYRLLNVQQVCELTSWSPTTLDRKVASGDFPRPIEDGRGSRRKWTLSQYEKWARQKEDAASR